MTKKVFQPALGCKVPPESWLKYTTTGLVQDPDLHFIFSTVLSLTKMSGLGLSIAINAKLSRLSFIYVQDGQLHSKTIIEKSKYGLGLKIYRCDEIVVITI